MKRFKPVLAVTVLLMGVGGVGCAKGKGSIHTQNRGEAPRGPEDVGVLVDGARVDQVETLLGEYPNAQVRVLDANRGFYEIFGVTVAETQGLLPEADVNLNEYIRFKPWSAPVPAGSVLPGLKPCRVGANPPQTVLNVSSPAGLKNGMIVERGFELRADGKASRSQSSEDQTLKTVMMVLGPASSAFREKVLTEDSVD
ncbi:MAG TPA: hypothetical protein PKC28_12045, partial [Bdellovibrionales bacterium]|nr:hypothetical protein [Bdellovibrionales bacterium]